jgi:methylated-DNA-protein-cysteine methyltransferase-like protein
MNGAHELSNPVPAHRVVNRNGLLSGKFHFPGEDEMQKRLEEEGVLVENDQVVNMKELFWDPTVELL